MRKRFEFSFTVSNSMFPLFLCRLVHKTRETNLTCIYVTWILVQISAKNNIILSTECIPDNRYRIFLFLSWHLNPVLTIFVALPVVECYGFEIRVVLPVDWLPTRLEIPSCPVISSTAGRNECNEPDRISSSARRVLHQGGELLLYLRI